MSQSINLTITGINTSVNDYQGIPPGAQDVADNAEIRYMNLAEPRRGFDSLASSDIGGGVYLKRMIDFYVTGVSKVVAVTSTGILKFYNGAGWTNLAGSYSTGITDPNSTYAKSRFIKSDQSLYVTNLYGVVSFPSGSGSSTLLAGVPAGLNISAVLAAGTSGIIDNNVAANAEGIFSLLSPQAHLLNQGIIYTAVARGSAGNLISVEFTAGAVAGAEVVTVVGTAISVQIQNGVSTPIQVYAKLIASAPAMALATVALDTVIPAVSNIFGPSYLEYGQDLLPNSISNVSSLTDIAVGQYVYASGTNAYLDMQSLRYTAIAAGAAGNAITIRYVGGGVAGAETVAVVGSAITVTLQSGVSTAQEVLDAVTTTVAVAALVTIDYSPGRTNDGSVCAVQAATPLANGVDVPIVEGTTVTAITSSFPVLTTTGDLTAGNSYINNIPTQVGVLLGDAISGPGIPTGATIIYISADGVHPGNFIFTLSIPGYITGSAISITITRQPVITLSANVASTNPILTAFQTYTGAQAAYQIVFGRVETQLNGTTVTRLGAPSAIGTVINTTHTSKNVTVTATIPKNSSQLLTFYRVYRSPQTPSALITPQTQYQLCYEAALTGADFTARVVTFTDIVSDALLGLSLYSGSDQEGSGQENGKPPSCWDMCVFNNFALYANITRPCDFDFTVTGLGAPNGVQLTDTITIAGTIAGVAYSRAYTASAAENQAARQFKLFTTGTISQNITDTVNSLIAVINYDNAVPVHAVLISTSTDLPGQVYLQADNPTNETFTVTASAHTGAYNPALTGNVSDINTIQNGIAISKIQQNESVPLLNFLPVGNLSTPILRIVPQRNCVHVIKSDGIYKIVGSSPHTLSVSAFDLTCVNMGPDTVGKLNGATWMFSNQGIVAISDGGVNSVSVPVDNDLNTLVASYQDNIIQNAFCITYESDRKYILCTPNSSSTFAQVQYNYNYQTKAFTTWSRNFYTGFINSSDNKLYVSRADASNKSVSLERKAMTFRDFVDEPISVSISSQVGQVVTLNTVSGVSAGDILYVSNTVYALILSVSAGTTSVTVTNGIFSAGAASVLKAFTSKIFWKQNAGDNPAFYKQFAEGQILFKTANFTSATMGFFTNFSTNIETTPITGLGTGNGAWGMFPWGTMPWGGITNVISQPRFYIPAAKQLAAWIEPQFTVTEGYAAWRLMGCSLSFYDISQEVGKGG